MSNQITLSQFVQTTLSQIMEGVNNAQDDAKSKKVIINPSVLLLGLTSNATTGGIPVYHSEEGNNFHIQMVEFDINITTEEIDSATGGIGVFIAPFTLGVKGSNKTSDSQASRIKFSIPITFAIQEERPRKVVPPRVATSHSGY